MIEDKQQLFEAILNAGIPANLLRIWDSDVPRLIYYKLQDPTGLFEAFSSIATHEVLSQPIPAEFEVEGYFFRYEKHFVYWKTLSNGDIGIVLERTWLSS